MITLDTRTTTQLASIFPRAILEQSAVEFIVSRQETGDEVSPEVNIYKVFETRLDIEFVLSVQEDAWYLLTLKEAATGLILWRGVGFAYNKDVPADAFTMYQDDNVFAADSEQTYITHE